MNKILKIFKTSWFWLAIIIALGLVVRLYKIDSPIADWHSWRQADTASVSRVFYQEGFNPLIPKYDNMLGESGSFGLNPNRYRFVEFPVYNSVVYFLYLLKGGVDEALARLVSIVASLGSAIFIFIIVRRYWGTLVALISSGVFLFLPYNIYFSRVILPEPTLVFFSLGMFYYTDRWIRQSGQKLFFLSLFFTVVAFLIKPLAVFYLLPLVYSYWQKEGKIWPIPKRYWLWIVISFTPLLAWRMWMSRFPEGVPASAWLLNGNNIRFKPAFWKWILGDRFGREILTVTGTVLFFFGLLKKPTGKEGILLHLFILSSLLYLIVFATGNVQHDYYQALIIPALSMGLSYGFVSLLRGIPSFAPRIWTIPLALLFFVLTFYFGWNEVKGLYQINNPVIVEAGQTADKILPKDAKVIAPYQGDTAFLYQINRPGWPVIFTSINQLVLELGATHYVSVNYDAKTKWIMKKYTIMKETPGYIIVDLTKLNPDFDQKANPEPF